MFSFPSAKPISTLDPSILVEEQSFRVAATCRAMAKPQPGLSWDTDLPGQSQNRSLDNGVSSIQYFLHPLRSMNGRKLDCLVWHPSLKSPRRLTNVLVVHCEFNIMLYSGCNCRCYTRIVCLFHLECCRRLTYIPIMCLSVIVKPLLDLMTKKKKKNLNVMQVREASHFRQYLQTVPVTLN